MALSLLELTVGIAIFSVGAIAVTSTGLATNRLEREDRDHKIARLCVESVADEIAAASRLAAVEPSNWARTLIERFEDRAARPVPGLEPWTTEDAVIGITFVVDETATDELLGVTIGMPRDLEHDGASDSTDVTDSARLLPVIVTARWTTGRARREIAHAFYVQAY